jgi:hypothetical protein
MADKPDPATAALLEQAHAKTAACHSLVRRFARAEAHGIERFAGILHRLSDHDLDRVARFAEGLAEWPSDDVGSNGAAQGSEV